MIQKNQNWKLIIIIGTIFFLLNLFPVQNRPTVISSSKLVWNANASNSPNLVCYSFTINYDTDGDNLPEAGETVGLIITIENTGTTGATAVGAHLSISDLSVTIDDDYEGYGNIAAGATADCFDEFVFSVASDCVTGYRTFTLDINADEGSWQDTFNMVIYGTEPDTTPPPAIPGFPWLAIVPAIAAALTIGIMNRRHQQNPIRILIFSLPIRRRIQQHQP